MSTRASYSLTQIGLHWVIALLIVSNWFLGDGMNKALEARIEAGTTGLAGGTWHVWIGGAVFLLILIRIAVRFASDAPAAISGGSALLDAAALWGHRLLYLLMVLVPTLGAITWYLRIDGLGQPHALLSNLLLIVALGHAAAGLWHHYVSKDETLRRMLRPNS